MKLFNIMLLAGLFLLGGCQQTGNLPPIETEAYVDLERFMGDWYVIAAIPIFIEDEAYDGIESYELADDGRILTTYTFRDGGFDGKLREFHPVAFVRENTGNAVWGMQFIWPIKAEYRVLDVDDDYSTTIIGRSARDYVWLMARTPSIPDAEYQRMVDFIEAEGYDTSELRRVPQSAAGNDG